MKVLFKYITVLVFALLFINKVDAANITSNVVNGTWSSTLSWVGGVVPRSGDNVTIAAGALITLNADAACTSITFIGAQTVDSKISLAGYTLTISGALTIPRADRNANMNSVEVGSGTLNAGSIAFTAGGGTVAHQITISTGTVNVSGDITIDNTISNSAAIVFTGAGTLNAGVGIMTTGTSGGTLTTVSGSTINYNGTADQTIKAVTYNGNLTLSGSGKKTFTSNTTITGNLSIASGVTAALGDGLTHTLSGNLNFNGATQTPGKWGYGSPATSTNTTYFTNTTGVIINAAIITNTWTGAISNVWETAGNWSKGFVPTSSNTDSVVIANISGKQPIINSTVSIASMSIATGATLSVQGTNSLSISGNLNNSGTLSGTSSTIAFTGAAQKITSSALTFFNLTLSGTGAKTFTNGPTVNGTLTMGGSSATMSISSGSLTYGTSAGLLYNKTTAFTATSTEFKTSPASVPGGITIGGTGAITQQSSSVTLINTVLTINSGATFKFYTGGSTRNFTTGSNVINNGTLNFGSKTVTFNADLTNTGTINGSAGTIVFAGNFSNTGSFTGNSGPITISGTGAQSIGGFTTTGSLTINKTAGIATFTGPVNGANLSLTGSTGTLNLGTGLTHTFTGTWASSTGTTLDGGSSTINFTNSTVSGTLSGTFTPSTGTVGFTASAAQTVPALTYYNLTIGGTSAKTFATTPTVNGTLSMEGTTASVVVTSGVVTYGGAATLKYNKTAAYTATAEEWISPFAATGGIIIAGTSAITPPGAVQMGTNANVPLTINSGATLSPGSNLLTLHGNFTNNGTLTSGAGGITFAGTISQTINGFTTTGNVSMTKTAGIATLTGNVNAANLSLSGYGGTLNLGTSLTHIFSGTYSSSTGSILNGGSSELQFTNATVAGNLSGTFTPATSTVTYSGTNQTVASLPYYNLKLTGSGTSTKTYSTTPFSVSNLTWVDSAKSVKISMSTGTYTTTYLEYNGNGKLAGTYGSSSSGANYQSSSLYAGSGKLNVNSTSGNTSSGILTQLITTFAGETYSAGSNSGTPTAVNAGTNTITIHAIDALYANISTYTGTKSLTVEEIDASSLNVINTSTQSISFTNGVATNAQIPITQVGNKIIRIKEAGSYGVNSSVVAVLPGTASKLIISAQPTTATAGVAISPSIQITLQDAYSNTVTSTAKTVSLAIGANPSSGSLSGTLTATTVNGIATFSNVSIDKSGTAYTLTAAASGVASATSSSFNINPSTATKLGFITQPSNGSSGLLLNPSPRVAVQDTYGNTVTSITDDITIAIGTNPSSGSLTGSLVVTTNNGVASFDDLSIDLTGTGYTLDATSAAAYTHKVSNTFNITSSDPTQLAFTRSPIDTLAGKIIAPIVEVQDANGNIITDGVYASSVVTLSLSAGTGALTGTLSMTAINGVADFSTNPVFITTAGTNKILTAVASGLSSATSTSFVISAAAPTQLSIKGGNAQTAIAGNAVSVAPSIILKDVYNNLVSGNTISFSVTGGGGTVSPISLATDASGIATATSWTLGATAGTNTLTATTGALSVTFTATGTVGAASQISINAGNGQTAIAGAAVSTAPSVIVKDANNNPVSGVSVTFAVAGGGGTVTPTSVTTNASGIAAVTSWTLGTTAGTNTLTASINSGALTATFTATGTAGAVNKLAFTTQPSSTTVAGTAFATQPVVTVQDQYGNTVTSSSVAIALTLTTGTGTLSGTTTINASSGVATFTGLNINLVGADKVLTASTLGLTNATTSPAFSITPAAASKLVFTTQPSAATIQNINFAQQPVVTVQDRFGNTVTSSSASIVLSLSTGTGTLIGTTTVSASSGVATFSGLNINTAGSDKVLTASSGALTVALSSVFTIVSVGDFVITLTPTSANCAKLGSVAVSITGGVSPFKYDWSDITGTRNDMNRVGLLSGTYTLTVTDGTGVVNTKAIFVDGDLSNCTGQTVCKSEVASAFSTDPDPSNSSYTWSILPDAGATFTGDGTSSIKINWTLAPVGVYSVCVTAHNVCGTSTQTCKTVYVKQPDISAFADPTCSGSNLNLHASGAYNYSWLGPNAFSSNSANPVIYNATSGTANGTYTLTATDINGCVASSTKTINFSVDALPSIDASGVSASANCSDIGTGTISLTTVTGGVSFTYAWSKIGTASYSATSQNITALSTGGYIVNVTNEKGCSTNKNFSVTSAGGPTVSATNSNVACFNSATGTISLTVASGTGTYSYTWINSTGTFTSTNKDLSHLAAGNYSVQVTDGNNCKVSTDVTITQPVGPLSAEATLTNINCKNAATGTISLNVFGGTSSPSYHYAWVGAGTFSATTKDISSLVAGTYTVTISDGNSCPYTNSYTITQPAGILSATAALTNINCFGGTTGIVNLTTSGGTTPYTYTWSKIADGTFSATTEDIAGLTAGTYSVTITDSKSCTVTPAGFVITQPVAALSIATPTITNVNCFGGNNGAFSINVTGGTSGYTYVWSNGATTNSLTSLTAGTYTTTVTDQVGCTITNSYNVTQPAAALAATVSSYNDISCNGGSNGAININVTGGTATYTYAWTGPSSYTNAIQNISSLSPGKYNLTVTDTKNCVASANQTLIQPDAIVVNATVTNNLCNGNTNGAITLNVSGGTGTYTYSWNTGAITNSITALSAGTYSVTVTDANNCTSIQTYTITQPTALATPIASTTNLTCNGSADGAISLTVSGGVSPYTYAWTGPSSFTSTSKDISSLSAGTYTVTVTDQNGCTSSLTPTALTQPTAITASATATNINCFGQSAGTITLVVSGGTASYTYLWNDASVLKDRTSLIAGDYSVTIKDANSCSTSISAISITQPAAALVVTGTKTNILCNGNATGEIVLTTSGGTTPYTYTWTKTGDGTFSKTTDVISTLTTGTYSVSVVDNKGCTVAQTYTITQPTALATPIASTTNLTCNGSADGAISLTISGGVSPYTYAWTGPSSFTSTSKDISSLSAGTYTVTVTDQNGCTSSLTPTALTQPTAITASATATNINCFGQSAGTITLAVSGGTASYTYLWNDASVLKDRTSLIAGDYNVTIKDANSCSIKINSIAITQPAAALSLTETKTNILCNGNTTGSIDITLAGGSIPYTYVWSKTGDVTYNKTTQDIDLLGIGTYSVVVTDNNGCTISNSSLITQPTAIVASLTNTNLTCNGASDGAINLTIDGGVIPYTYAWTGPSSFSATTKDISGLAIGTYTLTITDANNCISTLTSTALTQPDAYSIKAKLVQNVNCYKGKDGSASVGSIGGASPYTYSWSNGSTDSVLAALKSGKYVVSAIDANGCKAKDSISITQPANALKVYGNVTDTRACAGTPSGKIDVEVVNATGALTYTWKGPTSIGNIKSPSSLAAGDYTLSITDSAGCIATMSKTVGKATALTVTATGQSKSCATLPDGSAYAVVAGGVAPYTYLWSTKDTTQSIKGLNTNTFTVQVIDANGCTATDSTTLTDPLCDLPVAVSDVFVSTNGSILTNSIAMNDSDSLYAPTELNFQLLNLPGTEQGSIVADLNGDFIFTPTADYNGIVNLKYLVSNPLNLSSKAAFRIYVSHITITDTVVNSTCDAGGAINLMPHGGFPGYTYSWTGPGDFKSTARNINALSPGDYIVSITDSVGANIKKTYTITDNCVLVGNSTIYLSGTNAFTYNAAPQGPKTYVKHGSTGAVTIVYSGVASTTYATSSTFPSMPGTYKAIATLAADANKTGATSVDFLFTIDKAPLTITAYDVNAYYGDPISSVIKAGTYSITGFIGNDTDSVIKGKVSFITNYKDTTKAGTQEITITPVLTALSADNYTFKAVSGTVNILTVTAIRPLPPKVNNGKFIFGNLSNPKTIRSLVYEIPKSTIPVWCDVVTNLCDSVAPALPKIIGKYVFVLKSLDTTTRLYSAESVNDTVVIRPPAPTVIDSTYILGLAANPVYIALQVNGMAGTTISYFVNNTKQTASPKLPNALGTFNYTVTQTVNTIESDSSRFKINMLNANDLVHLQKLVDSGVLQANSTFNYTFTFLVSNLTNYPMSSVVLSDNLQNSVPITSDFNIVSNKSTGGLVAAANYNGSTSINLTDTVSKVLANQVDTTHLIVNISPKGYAGNLTNIANVKLQTKWGTLNMASSADTKLNETSKRPTPYTIKDLAIVIPEGFSPNHDGINDKFVIIKPFEVTIEIEVYNRWGTSVYKSNDYKNDWDGKGTGSFIGQDLSDGGYYYIVKANNYNGGTKIFNGYIIIQR